MGKLSENRDLTDYIPVIDTLFMSYVRTDDYAASSDKERNTIVDCCQELKDYINDLIIEHKS